VLPFCHLLLSISHNSAPVSFNSRRVQFSFFSFDHNPRRQAHAIRTTALPLRAYTRSPPLPIPPTTPIRSISARCPLLALPKSPALPCMPTCPTSGSGARTTPRSQSGTSTCQTASPTVPSSPALSTTPTAPERRLLTPRASCHPLIARSSPVSLKNPSPQRP
jgi:hypothetical protein